MTREERVVVIGWHAKQGRTTADTASIVRQTWA